MDGRFSNGLLATVVGVSGRAVRENGAPFVSVKMKLYLQLNQHQDFQFQNPSHILISFFFKIFSQVFFPHFLVLSVVEFTDEDATSESPEKQPSVFF